jgi:hypothetical protein
MQRTPEIASPRCIGTPVPQEHRRFKIVTFYEEFPDAIRAHQAFDTIARKFCGDEPVKASSWSFTLLGRADLNALILADVASADVVVVAASGAREIPRRIATWIEISLDANPDRRPVVLALHEDGLKAEGAGAQLCSGLEKIAGHRNARFMCNADLESHAKARLSREPRIPAHTGAGHSTELAGCSTTESTRRWGIND